MENHSGHSTASLRISCASCGAKFLAEDAHSGDSVACGLCGTEVMVERAGRSGRGGRRRTTGYARLVPRWLRRASRRTRAFIIGLGILLVVLTAAIWVMNNLDVQLFKPAETVKPK